MKEQVELGVVLKQARSLLIEWVLARRADPIVGGAGAVETTVAMVVEMIDAGEMTREVGTAVETAP